MSGERALFFKLINSVFRITRSWPVFLAVIPAAALSFWPLAVGISGNSSGRSDFIIFNFGPSGEPRLNQKVPDFGSDGLKSLTEEEKTRLLSGEVVLVSSREGAPEGKTIISAALIFEAPVEKAWGILSATELQVEYLKEIEELKVVERGPDFNRMFFQVRVLGKRVRYTVIHHFAPDRFYLWWELDRTRPSDLKELYGFWVLFRHDAGRTLARYGSYVKPDFPVPAFIRNWLSRSNVRSSLAAVKKYVEGK